MSPPPPATPAAGLTPYPAEGDRYWGEGPTRPRQRPRAFQAVWDLAAEEEPPGPPRLELPGQGDRPKWCGMPVERAYHLLDQGDHSLIGHRTDGRSRCPHCGGYCGGTKSEGCVLGRPHLGGFWSHRLAAGLAAKMERFRLEAASPEGCRIPPSKAFPNGKLVRYEPPRCPTCRGSFLWHGMPCPSCGGPGVDGAGTVNGWLQVILSVDPRRWSEGAEWVACPSCGGRGLVGERPCRRCNVTGNVSSHVLMVAELRRLLLRRVKEWAWPGVPAVGLTFVHPWRDDHELEHEGDGTPIVHEDHDHPEYDVHGPHIHSFVPALDIRNGATARYYERTTERCEKHRGMKWDDLKALVPECPDCREGHIVKVVTVDGKPGSPFKVYRGIELEKAIVYELSHVGILKGKHSVTEFGVLKLLPTPEPETEDPVCHEDGEGMIARPPTAETFESLSVDWSDADRPTIVHRVPGSDKWRRVGKAWDADSRSEEGKLLEYPARALAVALNLRPPKPPAVVRALIRDFNRAAKAAKPPWDAPSNWPEAEP